MQMSAAMLPGPTPSVSLTLRIQPSFASISIQPRLTGAVNAVPQ